MNPVDLALSVLAGLVLFLYGLQGLAKEVQNQGGAALQAWLGRVTRHRWRGFLIGASVTAVVQSSSAVSSITVALVDAGAISFRNSLALLFGSNVGTTATAWLVSFKLTGIGPIFLIIGSLLSFLPIRLRVFGKALFYFGFIFFSLGLISDALQPLCQAPELSGWLARVDTLWLGILVGLAFTVLVQSSSVTTGLAIVLVQQGMLPTGLAIAIVLGANIGTASTAVLASLPMGRSAKRAALANALFNIGGVALFLPFLGSLLPWIRSWATAPDMTVALVHLSFNLATALVFLLALRPFARMVELLLPLQASDPAKPATLLSLESGSATVEAAPPQGQAVGE